MVVIIFLNLMVAILTYTFENAAKSAQVLFYMDIVGRLQKLEYDKTYGCLVTLPIICNFLNGYFLVYMFCLDPS